MINKNLPESPEDKRYCVFCGKRKRLSGTLIHYPNENYEKDEVTLLSGQKVHSFSTWLYECAWCRGIETKRKARVNALLNC